MKEIIFIIFISHVFSVYYIEKHGSVKVTTREGIVYLDADQFGKNDKIHIQFNAYKSHVDDNIYYEFSDNIPTDKFQPSFSKKPNFSWKSNYNDEDETNNTYKTSYDIKKDVSAKYLIIKYTEYYNYYYSGGNLKIENTLINWGLFREILIYIFWSISFLICIIICYFKIAKKKCKKNRSNIEPITATHNTNDNNESSHQEEDIYYEPSSRENDNRINDSNNNNLSQQENIYYEPPNIENTDTNNNSNNYIP